MRRKNRNKIPSKIILAVMVLVCIILLFTSYVVNFTSGPIHTIANYLFVPKQKGIDYVGNTLFLNSEGSLNIALSCLLAYFSNKSFKAKLEYTKNLVCITTFLTSLLEILIS